ncbi:MAG: choice-of-anchor A family protein [Microthrixaceae bacterium]|nr:choice-of-anchor A family protein [Microthrixaceae bacterium]
MPVRTQSFSSSPAGGVRRVLAAAATLAVIGAGALVSAAPAAAAPSSACAAVNPMEAATPTGSETGYTLFVRDDAILANSELEGTLAVGGTATFGDPRGFQSGQYPILQGGVGGNADYAVPTIGGEPNRVLVQRFAADGKVVQVKADGASGANAQAGAKIGDQSTPADYTFGPMFGGSGTTFFPIGGGNMSPQIESWVQPWVDLEAARESWGIDGDVRSHFPSDNGASVIQSFTNWQPVAAPGADDQTITLSAAGPSRLPLSDFAGYNKFKLEGYSEFSFLVITVDPTDVVGGRVSLPAYSFAGKDGPQKEGISYILFDFSAITGDVEVVSPNEPVRGALYAPNTHIIFPSESDGGREFEGQLIARQLTALQDGRELHTNLFKGRFPCAAPSPEGTFSLRKALAGIDAADFPAGTTFPVTATWSGGEATFQLPADGAVVPSGVSLPEGTVVTLAEGALPAVPQGYEFVSTSPSSDTITILADGAAEIAWSVTNTYAATLRAVGGFDLSKTLRGVDAKDVPSGTLFTVTASWQVDGIQTVREYALPGDGSTVVGARDLPAGTEVSFGEVRVPAFDGYTFGGVEFTPATLIVTAGEIAQVTAENTYRKGDLAVTGGAAASGVVIAGVLLLLAGGAVLMLRRMRPTA